MCSLPTGQCVSSQVLSSELEPSQAGPPLAGAAKPSIEVELSKMYSADLSQAN